MIWILMLICFFVLVGFHKAGLCSAWQVVLAIILLPLFPVIFWIIVGYYAIKLAYNILFTKWA